MIDCAEQFNKMGALLFLLFARRESSPGSTKWVLYYFCYLPGVSHPLVQQNGCFIISVICQAWAIPWFIKMGALLFLLFARREPSSGSSKWVLYYFCYLPGVSHSLVHQNGCFIISVICQAWAIPWFNKMGALLFLLFARREPSSGSSKWVFYYLLLVIRREPSPGSSKWMFFYIYFTLKFIHYSQIYQYDSIENIRLFVL